MEKQFVEKICDNLYDDYYSKQEYKRCITNAKFAYRNFIENNVTNYYIWIVLIMAARSYQKLDIIDKVIKYNLWSLRYAELECREIESYNILAYSYIKQNNIIKANYCFDKCINYYERIQDFHALENIKKTKAWINT